MFDRHADVIRVNTQYVAWLLLWCHHNTLNDDGRMHRLLHHCRCISDIWYSCTYWSWRRAVVITDTRRVKWYSGDISHKQNIALSLFTRRSTLHWLHLQCP